MKKRILSIALAVVMVVGMAATLFTGVSAVTYQNEASFDTYVSANALTVDAQKDDIYNMSEQVSNAYTNYTRGTGTGFDAWQVATAEGIYVYAEMDDTTVGSEYLIYNDKRDSITSVSNADKFQYYFKFEYVDGTSWWGYFEMNYYAHNVDGETMVDNEITSNWNKHYYHARYQQRTSTNGWVKDTAEIPAGVQYASKILRDSNGAEYGWVAEFFIPWTVGGNVPAAQYEAGTLPKTNVGLQVNNDDWAIDEGKTAFGDGWVNRQGYCYSNYSGCEYYNGPSSSIYIPLNFSTNSFAKYDVFLTSQHIELDGKMDEAYKNSTKMYNEQGFIDSAVGGVKGTVNFAGYTVATLNGIYIYVEVEDETMNNIKNTNAADGEMVQVYLDWSPKGTAHSDPGVTWTETDASRDYLNKVYGSWMGWFQADYEGNLSGSFHTDTRWLNHYGAEVAVEKYENPDWDGQDAKTQYVGYAIEFFVPYNDYMQYVVDTQNFSDYHFSIGLQVNDDETYNYNDDKTYMQKVDEDGNPVTDENGNPVYDTSKPLNADGAVESGWGENRTSIGYTYGGGSYWDKFENIPEARLVPDKDLPKHTGGTTVSSITFDGKNTDGEYDGAQVIYVDRAGSGNGDGDIYRVVCDGEYVYVLMEMVDNTPTYSSTKASLGYTYHDYNDFYYARWNSSMCQWDGAYSSVTRETNNPSSAISIDNGVNGWTSEIRWPLSDYEKMAFAKGEFLFAVSMQYLDGTATATGRQYKYDHDHGGVFYGGSGETYSAGFRKFVFGANTVADTGFTGANVALGESINVNYYANLNIQDTDAKVRFTFNDEVVYVGAKATEIKDQYVFTFEGIAPQCMGDNIKAELIVDGVVVDTKAEYSVFENCMNLINAGKLDEQGIKLVADLGAYGAAAQKYAYYKTDALVNAGYEGMATVVGEIVNNDRTVSAETIEGVRFSAAGVYHANANKIYAKVTAASAANLTVTINGKAAELEEYADGVYIVYTDDLKVTEFDKVFTFVLSDGTNSQTLTYSVNAYCAVKQNAENAKTAELAKAMYAYGLSAEAYAAK